MGKFKLQEFISVKERLLSQRKITQFGCWEWTGRLKGQGRWLYGIVSVGGDGKEERAHRAAFMEWRGPIPRGVLVLHKCDNPSCFNPDHLFLGSNKDNVRDAIKKGRNASGLSRLIGAARNELLKKLLDKQKEGVI